MLVEWLVAAFVIVYGAILVLGHVLLLTALFSRADRSADASPPTERKSARPGHPASAQVDGRLAA